MIMENKKPRLPGGQTVVWKDEAFPTVYSNLIGFSLTPFDISIMFGEVGEGTHTEIKGTPKVKVLLSPEQASNLMKLLGVAIKSYVEANGLLRAGGAVNIDDLQKQMDVQKTKSQ